MRQQNRWTPARGDSPASLPTNHGSGTATCHTNQSDVFTQACTGTQAQPWPRPLARRAPGCGAILEHGSGVSLEQGADTRPEA